MSFQEISGQVFEKYADQLFFGMLSRIPDTAIAEFAQKYVPIIYRKFDTGGKWAAYPPDYIEEPKFLTVNTSYVFYKHPYFDAHFKSGELAVTQKIYNEKKWIDNITDFKLWFYFDDEADARNSYQKLVDTFSSFNVLRRLTSTAAIDKAEFTDKNSNSYANQIEIVLAKDYFNEISTAFVEQKPIKMVTKSGYKILLKIGNELYDENYGIQHEYLQ